VGDTLRSGGGGLNPLSTTTDNFTLASDIAATDTAGLGTFATGAVSSAYIVTSSYEIGVDGAGTGNTLLTQAGIDEAVAYFTGNGIAATTTANTNVILGIDDGTNTAFFQYQEGALDAGIQSSELTLIGVYGAQEVADFAIANFA